MRGLEINAIVAPRSPAVVTNGPRPNGAQGERTGLVLRALEELTDPLTTVRLCLTLAADPALAKGNRELLAMAAKEAEVMQQSLTLLRETLESSLPDAVPERFDLRQIVAGVMQATTAPQRMQLTGEPVVVKAPLQAMRVTLACLLTSALRLGAPSGPIDVAIATAAETAELRVSFLSAPAAESDRQANDQAGTLALARSLANSCGGELAAHYGCRITSFFLTLPVEANGDATVQ